MGQGHGKKKSLKAGLQAHQARLQARQKAVHVAQGAEQKGKQRRTQNARSSTVPFRPTDKILLVGEGNFSFTRALLVDPPSVLEHLPPANVTATSYDSEEDCYAKYTDARQIVDIVRSHGAQVLFGVDATRLHGSPALKGRRWDRIVWNFPHAGELLAGPVSAFLDRALKERPSRTRTETSSLTSVSCSTSSAVLLTFSLTDTTRTVQGARSWSRCETFHRIPCGKRVTLSRDVSDGACKGCTKTGQDASATTPGR